MLQSEHYRHAESSAVLLATAIKQTSLAIAICDAEFGVLYFNASAASLLDIAHDARPQSGEPRSFWEIGRTQASAIHAAIKLHGSWRGGRTVASADGPSRQGEATIEVSSFHHGDAAKLLIVAWEVEPATSGKRLASDSDLIRASSHLTLREKDVMLGLLVGRTSKTIGREMGISPRTVEFHRAKLLLRYGAKSHVELIQKVIHNEKPGLGDL